MLGTLQKIFEFAGNKKRLLIRSLIFSFISGIFIALQFAALYITISSIFSNTKDPSVIWMCLGCMLLSIIGRTICSVFSMNQQTVVGYGMVADKRISIGNRLKYVPMGFFNKNNVGELTGVVTTTLADVENFAPIVLVNTVGGFLNTLILVLCLLVFYYKLGLLALIGTASYILVTEIATRRSTLSASLRQEAQRNLVESTLEYIHGMGVVKSYGLEKGSDKSILSSIEKSRKGNLKIVYTLSPFLGLQQLVVRIFSWILLLFTIYSFINSEITAVYGIVYVILSFTMFGSLESAGSQVTMLQMLAAAIDTANEAENVPYMDESSTEQDPENVDITFNDVEFSYDKRKILDKINVSIPQDTTTAIIGPSGSGKTTMCNLIARFWDVDSGNICIGGIDIRDYTLDSLMKNISMVFQNVYLFADTIENNIKFGMPDASHEQVVEAAKKARCHDFITALPDGYDTVIGEGGSTLSGGEKQRISIARAMIKDAPVIILDEATSSVDAENEAELQGAIEELTHDKTIIMIAHRLKTVRNADQILVLDQGHIVQRGTHDELINEPGLYADFIAARQEAIGWKLKY